MSKIIFLHRWIELIVALDKYNGILPLSKLSGRINLTFAWAHKTFKAFEERNWIEVTKVGRSQTYTFTTEGLEVLELARNMIRVVEGDDHPLLKRLR